MAPGRKQPGRLAVGGQRDAAKLRRSRAGFLGERRACRWRKHRHARRGRRHGLAGGGPLGRAFHQPPRSSATRSRLVQGPRLSARRGLRGARRHGRPRPPPAPSRRSLASSAATPGIVVATIDRIGRSLVGGLSANSALPVRVCSAPSRMASISRAGTGRLVLRIMLSMSPRAGANSTPPASTASAGPSTAGPAATPAARSGTVYRVRRSRDRWGRREGVKRQAVSAAPIPGPPGQSVEAGWRRRARRRPGPSRPAVVQSPLGLASSSESSSRASAPGGRSATPPRTPGRRRRRGCAGRSGVHLRTSSAP